MNTSAEVERHYTSDNIAGRILAALREVHGADTPITPDALAPLDQFHGRGVVATEALAGRLRPQSNERLLDIGSGIGGPARWMAVHFGCHVTGIDLTRAFCEAAEALTAACGLNHRVQIVQGSATALPFPDAGFDRAWSQNALMNIADKQRFYREAFRVLRPGAMFAVDQIGAGQTGSPTYPMPWASVAETSFLSTPEQIRADITSAGFEIIELNDTTEAAIAFLEEARRRIQTEGPPRLGVHVVLGERFREVMRNSADGLTQHRVSVIQCLLRRPA
ncbi:MAG: class I SAM-dependent methyltransferase [Acetobacteraceae bacterium]